MQFEIIDSEDFYDILLGEWMARIAFYEEPTTVCVVYGFQPFEMAYSYESSSFGAFSEAKAHAMKWLLEGYEKSIAQSAA